MKKGVLNSYFTIHPTGVGTIGVIAAVLLAIALTENVLVLFALFMLPLLQSEQVIPEVDDEPGEYDGSSKFGFAGE